MLRVHRRRRHRVRRPLLHMVPNLFTILGLCVGLTGLRYGLDGRLELAVALILIAGAIDGLDGRSARLLNIQSRLGAELDSLADFFNFGVAPAILVYLWTLRDIRGVGWAIAMVFAVCCALRLARFNSELEDPAKPRWSIYFFTGIPAPAAAVLALTPMMLSFVTASTWPQSWWLNASLLMFVALMMVSRVPTFSVKRLRIKPDLIVPTLLSCGLVIAFLVTEPWLTLSLLAIAYIGSIPASVVLAARLRRSEDEPAKAGEAPPAASGADNTAAANAGSKAGVGSGTETGARAPTAAQAEAGPRANGDPAAATGDRFPPSGDSGAGTPGSDRILSFERRQPKP